MLSMMNESQTEKFLVWREEQDRKAAEKQGKDQPYYGASGGAYTYMFTPTTIGAVLKVRNNLTNEEIDLTDYEGW